LIKSERRGAWAMASVGHTGTRSLTKHLTVRRWPFEGLLTVVAYVILVIWAVIALFPIYWMVKTSVEPSQLLNMWPPQLAPRFGHLTLRGYLLVITRVPIGVWSFNSIIMTVVRTASTLFFSSMAGYSFAKLKFYGRETIFWILMSTLMIPSFILVIPLYQVVRALGWLDSFYALIVPGFSGGIGAMFLMRQFSRTLPTELMEAARIDGASEFGIFSQVILPLMKPGLAVLGIFAFISNWNSFLWPLLVTTQMKMRTLPVGLALLQSGGAAGQMAPDTGQIMAASTLLAIPMIIVFLAFQRYFLKGITIGAIKG
jgi:multiple sugar transport system permease protein